jgi:hypothetical protein
MRILVPALDVLPPQQRQVFGRLRPTPRDFVLYGGTALALRLGHRQSVDFDFFSSRAFLPVELLRQIPYLKDQSVIQEAESTLSCEVGTETGTVKLSFFGGLTLNQVEQPDLVESNHIAVASLQDLFGTKCATVPQRNEVKDYLDIHALLTKGRIELSVGIACAAAIYGRQYNPVLTLQALSYFDDLPESLPEAVKADLLAAVKSVSLQALPFITPSDKIGPESPRA